MSKLSNRTVCQCRKATCEESPGPIEQGCLITSSEGDLKESATENNRHFYGKGEKAR